MGRGQPISRTAPGKLRWCPGTGSNRRHCDFQSHALPTELPGPTARGRPGPALRAAPLTVVLVAVQPGIGRRARNAIAFAKPLQQVAILAAAAAERRMVGGRLAAQGQGLGGLGMAAGHGEAGRRASRRAADLPAERSSQSGRFEHGGSPPDARQSRPRPCRAARRSSARASKAARSAASSNRRGVARGRTIWRKPKPFTAVRSNGCRQQDPASSARRRLARRLAADVGRSMPIEPPMSCRRIAARRRRPRRPARAPRAASQPSTSIRVIAGVATRAARRRESDDPAARFLEQVRPAGRSSGRPARGRADLAAAHAVPMRAAASRRGERPLPRLGAGDRLARDLDRARALGQPGRRAAADIRAAVARHGVAPAAEPSAAPARRVPAREARRRGGSALRRSRPRPAHARVSPMPRSTSHSGKRVARALQQVAGLGERQADDVGIAAGDVADIDLAIALQRIAAGLAAPFAVPA
jgi:hypothetical protein